MIREADPEKDALRLSQIYNAYILESTCTMEESPISELDMKQRIKEVQDKNYIFRVYEIEMEMENAYQTATNKSELQKQKQRIIVGYSYLKNWMVRAAYRITLELSIYIDFSMRGKGIGSSLMEHMLSWADAKKGTYHSLISIISQPNEPSVKLHKKYGFEQVGHFKEVGFKFNTFIDVDYFQRILK